MTVPKHVHLKRYETDNKCYPTVVADMSVFSRVRFLFAPGLGFNTLKQCLCIDSFVPNLFKTADPPHFMIQFPSLLKAECLFSLGLRAMHSSTGFVFVNHTNV